MRRQPTLLGRAPLPAYPIAWAPASAVLTLSQLVKRRPPLKALLIQQERHPLGSLQAQHRRLGQVELLPELLKRHQRVACAQPNPQRHHVHSQHRYPRRDGSRGRRSWQLTQAVKEDEEVGLDAPRSGVVRAPEVGRDGPQLGRGVSLDRPVRGRVQLGRRGRHALCGSGGRWIGRLRVNDQEGRLASRRARDATRAAGAASELPISRFPGRGCGRAGDSRGTSRGHCGEQSGSLCHDIPTE